MKMYLSSIAALAIVCSSILISCGHKDDTAIVVPQATTVKDKDGNEYKIVEIGSQTWMAENLRANTNVGVTSCYSDKSDSCNLTGRLYDSTAMASNPCPNGWHVPTDGEWMTLEKYLGMTDTELSLNRYGYNGWRGTNEGTKLKKDSAGNVGFNAIFGGIYASDTYKYYGNNKYTYFWTSTQFSIHNTNYFARALYADSSKVFRDIYPSFNQNMRLCIRCIKN